MRNVSIKDDSPEKHVKHRVLVSAPYFLPVLDDYRAVFEDHDIEVVTAEVNERLSESELLVLASDVDGVISGDDQFTEGVLSAVPRLRVISKWGTGVDSIDREAARRHGVAVRNTPGAFTDPVADQIMAYVLSFSRRVPWMASEMREGGWHKQRATALSNCTLGIIGVGEIGKAVARRAQAFGTRLLGNDIVPMPAEFLRQCPIAMTEKSTVLRESDFVTLCCDLNPTSFQIVAEPELSMMKQSAVLVNCARGPLVEEAALVRALAERHIAGAALDVFENEPLAADSPLRRMDNVLLSPHNANSSEPHWRRIHELTIRNLIEELERCAGEIERSRRCEASS